MSTVSWIDVLSETKDTSPPPSSSPVPAAASASPGTPPRSPHRSGSSGRSSSGGAFTCFRPPEMDDSDERPSRAGHAPPRKLSRRTTDEDAGSGSDRSSDSPLRSRDSKGARDTKMASKPSFFTDQATTSDPPIWCAVNDGDTAAFKAALTSETARVQNKHKDTLLHQAVIRGRADIIRILLPPSGLPLVPIDTQNLYGETPFHRSCSIGDASIVQLLLERGANVNTPNVYGETPFYAAAYGGHTAIVELMLQVRGTRYRESGEENMRPINLARNRQHTAVVRAILKHERWRVQRVLWLAHLKNPSTPFAVLNKAIIRRIIDYLMPSLDRAY